MARIAKRQVVIGWCPSTVGLYDAVVQVFSGRRRERVYRLCVSRSTMAAYSVALSSVFSADVVLPYNALVSGVESLPLTNFDEFVGSLSLGVVPTV